MMNKPDPSAMKEEINNNEAHATLSDLEAVEEKAGYMVMSEYCSFPMILWGTILGTLYLLGYFNQTFDFQLFGQHPDRIAKWICPVGVCVTLIFIFLKIRYANPVRASGTFFERYRTVLLPLVWFLFYLFTLDLYEAKNGQAMNAFSLAFWMLMYVVYGFWFNSGLFITVGTVIGASAIIGYTFIGNYYLLWMAFMGGGTLILGGLYPQLKCRSKV